MVGGPREREGSAEVMRHQMDRSCLELAQHSVEVRGVMRDGVAPIGGFVGGAETREVGRDDAGELGDGVIKGPQSAPALLP